MIRSDRPVTVTVPGSKSITNRALLLAAMSEGTSRLRGCMTSDDARVFLDCLKTLGFDINEKASAASDIVRNADIEIRGCGGRIPAKRAELHVGSAGTAARFLVAMLALSEGEYLIDSSEQMKKRPMQPLIDALRDAGAEAECPEEEGHFPIRVKGAGRKENRDGKSRYFHVNIDQSSQFLSALLIAAGTLGEPVEIESEGSHGMAYVDMTVEMMREFGVNTERSSKNDRQQYIISGDETYRAREYEIEPDMSAAAYFYAAAPLCGKSICVRGVKSGMLQGDTAFLSLLKRMGCSVGYTGSPKTEKDVVSGDMEIREIEVPDADALADDPECVLPEGSVVVSAPADGILRGGYVIDMSAFSDQALTLAAIAPYADAPITIRGIGHIRLQECDRIRAICENLTRMGIRVTELEDGVTIEPGEVRGTEIETYEDHRVAMSFALCGLRTEGIVIRGRECCRKTFAEYFEVLEDLRQKIGSR